MLGWIAPIKQTADIEGTDIERCMIALQDELQWVMEKLELTQQDWDKKVALGRDMEAQLQSLWAELDFVNKQLATLQQQYQEVIGQAGYYKAKQDTLQSQLIFVTTQEEHSLYILTESSRQDTGQKYQTA